MVAIVQCMLTYLYIHTHASSGLLETWEDTHTYTPIPILDLVCTNSQISGCAFQEHFTYRQAAIHWGSDWWHTYTPIPTLDYLHKHAFLFHSYRRVFIALMQRYIQHAYIIHHWRTSLSRDCRIADRTGRHPGLGASFLIFRGLFQSIDIR